MSEWEPTTEQAEKINEAIARGDAHWLKSPERQATRAEKLLYERAYAVLEALLDDEYDDAEEAILDVLDLITGWCSPRNKVFPGVSFAGIAE